MNNKGIASGLAIILILIVAILIAFLVMKNIGSMGLGGSASPKQENYVQQAQNVVDQLNQAQMQGVQEP
jgi:preprotein translocase subunit SecG